MDARIADRNVLVAENDERSKLENVARLLAQRAESLPVTLGSHGESIELPDVAIRLLREMAEVLARGRAITFMSYPDELLPGEAAELLNVPRAQLARLFDEGELPFVLDDEGYRRVRLEDVLVFRERRLTERREGLIDLIRLSEELGLYESGEPTSGQQTEPRTG